MMSRLDYLDKLCNKAIIQTIYDKCWRHGKYHILSTYYLTFDFLKYNICCYYITISFHLDIEVSIEVYELMLVNILILIFYYLIITSFYLYMMFKFNMIL